METFNAKFTLFMDEADWDKPLMVHLELTARAFMQNAQKVLKQAIATKVCYKVLKIRFTEPKKPMSDQLKYDSLMGIKDKADMQIDWLEYVHKNVVSIYDDMLAEVQGKLGKDPGPAPKPKKMPFA